MFMGVMCTWVKLLTDLQILGCELLKNAFIRGRKGWKEKEMVVCREREEGEGREGREGVGRNEKGKEKKGGVK